MENKKETSSGQQQQQKQKQKQRRRHRSARPQALFVITVLAVIMSYTTRLGFGNRNGNGNTRSSGSSSSSSSTNKNNRTNNNNNTTTRQQQPQQQQQQQPKLTEEPKHNDDMNTSTTTRSDPDPSQWAARAHTTTRYQNNNATTTTTTNSFNFTKTIRRWGCHRSQTPAIFVHLGKAGGGSVRARFAAAALGYNRTMWYDAAHDPTYRYAVSVHDNDDDKAATANDDKNNATANNDKADATPATAESDDDDDDNFARGYFCNSGAANYRYHYDKVKTFEGTQPCHAATPLGHAVACPRATGHSRRPVRCRGCDLHQATCHQVYVGHNSLGNELHWLPYRYLQNWWQTFSSSSSSSSHQIDHDVVARALSLLTPTNLDWCLPWHANISRPEQYATTVRGGITRPQAGSNYDRCAIPLAQRVDDMANAAWKKMMQQGQREQQLQSRQVQETSSTNHHALSSSLSSSTTTSKFGFAWPSNDDDTTTTATTSNNPLHPTTSMNWGPLYASMPLLRTTVMREPFSWLLSMFFWDKRNEYAFACDDVQSATRLDVRYWSATFDDGNRMGWAHRTAMDWILHICGEDCRSRLQMQASRLGSNFTDTHEMELLQAFERQADYNLRHSFAVVGLNKNIPEFFDMVSLRVQYLDMSRNPHVTGGRHSAQATAKCQAIYQQVDFQQALLQGSPAIAALARLYETAVHVNAFQKRELATCSSRMSNE